MIAKPITTIRGVALERLIRVAQAMQRARCGLSLLALQSDVNETMGADFHWRTYLRDLQLLEIVGLVEISGPSARSSSARWIGEGGFFEQPATALRSAYDRVSRDNGGGSYSWSVAARERGVS